MVRVQVDGMGGRDGVLRGAFRGWVGGRVKELPGMLSSGSAFARGRRTHSFQGTVFTDYTLQTPI